MRTVRRAMTIDEKEEAFVAEVIRGIQARFDRAAELNRQLTDAAESGEHSAVRKIESELARIRKEDDRDWRIVVNRYQFELGDFLARKFSSLNHFDLQDLVQETYARAITRINLFGWRSSFKTWHFTIGRNLALNLIQKLRNTPAASGISYEEYYSGAQSDSDGAESAGMVAGPSSVHDQTYHSEDPESLAIRNETAKAVWHAISSLTPKLREALLLCDVELKSYSEIAEITGTKDGTVRSRINRARTKVFEETGIVLGKNKSD